MNEAALAKRADVVALVNAFRVAEMAVRVSFDALVRAGAQLNDVFTLGGGYPIKIDASHNGNDDDFENVTRTIDRMKRNAWGCIVQRLELRRFMSVRTWNELQETIENGDLPEITEENVARFAQGYMDRVGEMLSEAVTEVFDWLRPPGSQYKTNSELEIGRKVVLSYMVERAFERGKFHVRYGGRASQTLVALENVMNALDGKGSIAKSYQSEIQTAIEKCEKGRGETPLFKFRVFLNGNLHLEFKRLDLLNRFNQIAGGKRIRPATSDPVDDASALVPME